MREFIDKDKFWIDLQVQTPLSIAIRRNAITEQEIVKPYLEKIRAEIKALSPEPTAYDVVDGNPVKDAIWETLIEVDKIIDKYKAES